MKSLFCFIFIILLITDTSAQITRSAIRRRNNVVTGGTSIASGEVSSGLVVKLDAANRASYPTAGNKWYDISGNGVVGTLTNGPTYSTVNGGCIVFDGVDDYVTGSFTSFSSVNFTVEFWMNATASGSNNNSVTLNNYTNWDTYVFHNGTSGSVYTGTSVSDRFTPTATNGYVVINTWENYSFTYANKVANFYINGVLKQTATFAALPSLTTFVSFFIGKPDTNTINGKVGIFKIYNRALNSTEVSNNFNAFKARYGL